MLAFGLGCMTFEMPGGVDPGTEAGWQARVEDALKELASVSDLDVAPRDLAPVAMLDPAEEFFDFGSGTQCGMFRPHPRGGAIRFTVRIPKHIQDDLYPGPRGSKAGAEEFRVEIRYNARYPLAVVVARGAELNSRPQDAFIVVRQFLRRELALRSELEVGVIGPSPAWSDCFLVAGEASAGQSFAVEYVPGARRHLFTYDSEEFADDVEAGAALFEHLSREMTFYYDQQVRRNRRMFRARAVQGDVAALIALHGRKGFRAAASRLFKSGGLERAATLRALSALLAEQEDKRRAEEWIPRIYANDYLQAWRFFTDEVIRESYRPNLEYAQQIVELLGGRRSKEFEVSVVAASTLLGALAGALAALLAG